MAFNRAQLKLLFRRVIKVVAGGSDAAKTRGLGLLSALDGIVDAAQLAEDATPLAPGTSITAATISDSTAAGRALLTAANAQAQRALLDRLGFAAEAYGVGQPALPTVYGTNPTNNALAYVLTELAKLQAVAFAKAPPAPANATIDDAADTMAVDLVPGFPSLADYEAFGVTGVPGTVPFTQVGDLQGSRLVLRGLTGPHDPGTVGIRVAASGTRPAGASATNARAFTGTAVVTPPTDTTAPTVTLTVPAAGAVLTAGTQITLTATATDNLAVQGLAYSNGGTGAPIGAGAKNGNTYTYLYTVPATAGPLTLTATATDAAGNSQAATVNVTVQAAAANQIPVANAGQDVTLQLPGQSSVALMGTGTDADGTVTGYAWRQVTGPNAAAGLPSTAQNVVVSGLVAGTYQFGFKTQDNQGAYSSEDFVVVTVNAAATGGGIQDIVWTPLGDSLTFGAQVGGPGSGNTYPEQATVLLNQAAGRQRVSISENLGIPSRSAHYLLTDTTTYNGVTPVAHAISLVQAGKINVATVKCGANDLVYGDSGTDPAQAFTPAQVLEHVRQLVAQLKAGGYQYVFVDFVMNRTGYADFANFNTPRLAFGRLLLASTFADGLIDLPSFPLVYGVNAPNNTTYFNDGSHMLVPGHAETAKAYAQCFARHIAGFALPGGNGYEPKTAEDSTAVPAGAPPTYSKTTGFLVWSPLDNKGKVDAANSRRIYKTDPADDFGGTFLGDTLARVAASSTVKWQVILKIPIGAGGTQLVYASTNKNSLHFAEPETVFAGYWNPTNYQIFGPSASTIFPSTELPGYLVMQVVASDKIRFYYENATAPFATSSGPVPTADVYFFAEMGGVPANGKPEILDVQVFAANPIPVSGTGSGSTTPTITVTPQSAPAGTVRTATATIPNDPGVTRAQLFKQPTPGGASTAVGSPDTSSPFSVSFTPPEDGYYYYFQLTKPDSSFYYTDPPVKVSIAVPSGTVTTYRGNDAGFAMTPAGSWTQGTGGGGEAYTNNPAGVLTLTAKAAKIEVYGNIDSHLYMNLSLDGAAPVLIDGSTLTAGNDALLYAFTGLATDVFHTLNMAKAGNDPYYASITRVVVTA